VPRPLSNRTTFLDRWFKLVTMKRAATNGK
jgi:hypothetical protein